MSKRAYYILACDEHGTTRWPSPVKTWTLGGLVVDSRRQRKLASAWSTVKVNLCGTDLCELKWAHFFPGPHQQRSSNPLKARDPEEWRRQATWALGRLLRVSSVEPFATYVRKDRASATVFRITPDGRQVLQTDIFWVGVLGQFATFLQQRRAKGEVWFDQLGSRKEEARWQASWDHMRDGEWPLPEEHRAALRRISPELLFLDSRVEPLVQVADFISGIVRAASEGDEEFILRYLHRYAESGGRTFRILNIV
jgi:hypothetical protein